MTATAGLAARLTHSVAIAAKILLRNHREQVTHVAIRRGCSVTAVHRFCQTHGAVRPGAVLTYPPRRYLRASSTTMEWLRRVVGRSPATISGRSPDGSLPIPTIDLRLRRVFHGCLLARRSCPTRRALPCMPPSASRSSSFSWRPREMVCMPSPRPLRAVAAGGIDAVAWVGAFAGRLERCSDV